MISMSKLSMRKAALGHAANMDGRKRRGLPNPLSASRSNCPMKHLHIPPKLKKGQVAA